MDNGKMAGQYTMEGQGRRQIDVGRQKIKRRWRTIALSSVILIVYLKPYATVIVCTGCSWFSFLGIETVRIPSVYCAVIRLASALSFSVKLRLKER